MVARSERPIRREISWVRPPIRPFTDSRSLRVRVARGSIEYSAVTQPRPVPLRQRGTPCTTEAAQSTLVSPNSTSAEPSAYFCQSRVIVTGRSSSAARPSGREVSIGMTICGAADGGRRLRVREDERHAQRDDHGPHRQRRVRLQPDPLLPRVRGRTRPTGCSMSSCRTPLPDSRSSRPAPAATTICWPQWTDCCPATAGGEHQHGSPGHGRDHVVPAFLAAVAGRSGARRRAAAGHLAIDLPCRHERRQSDARGTPQLPDWVTALGGLLGRIGVCSNT